MNTSTIDKERKSRKTRIEKEDKGHNSHRKRGKSSKKKSNSNIISNVFTFLFSMGTIGIIMVLQ